MIGPLRPLPDRHGLEAVVWTALVAHGERGGWIETSGQQLAGAINERLAGVAGDDIALGLLSVYNTDMAKSNPVKHKKRGPPPTGINPIMAFRPRPQ